MRYLPVALVLAAASALGQHLEEATILPALAPGTTLPVALRHGLSGGHTAVGTPVVARTTQRVLLPNREYLPSGVEVLGAVTTSTSQLLSLHFTSLRFHNQTVGLSVSARAIANFTDVSDTAHPANGSTDRGNSDPASWTTQQVGGDQVARSGWSGPVVDTTTHTVGSADFYGVYALPASPSLPPNAMGAFSTTARGLFGFDLDCSLSSPDTAISVACAHSRATLHSGDNLLLQVLPSSSQQ